MPQNKDGGWTLPDPIDPPVRKGVCICLPDEINHIMAFWGNLQNLGYWFNWQRDPDHKALEVSILWNTIIAEAHAKWIEGTMCTSCAELIECLQPLMDELHAKLDAIQATVNETKELIEQQIDDAKLKPPEPVEVEGCDIGAIGGGALAVVQEMDRENRRLYAQAEIEGADHAIELADIIIELIPGFAEMPFDEIAELANWYFENQVSNYETDFTSDFEFGAACSLRCYIEANDCKFDYQVWGSWLSGLSALFPGNVAAGLYARYSPASITFANQVEEALDPDSVSLKSYFDDLYRAYFMGSQDPVILPDCECPEPFAPVFGLGGEACYTGDVSGDNLIFNAIDGIWEADGTLDTTTNNMRITLKEAQGRPFQFNTFTSNVGIAGALWTLASDGICYGGGGQFPPDDTPLLALIWAIQNTGTPLHVGFAFFE